MKAPDFFYARAATLTDAFALKAYHGPESRWLGGGQSLLPSLAFRLAEPTALIDISGLAELSGVSVQDGVLRIGGATTYAAIAAAPAVREHAPMLAEAIPLIAHTAIRNRGTIGGSLAFADPAAEMPACAVALDATLVLASSAGERRVAARDFFQGLYQTALADGELISAIEMPFIQVGGMQTLMELTRRSGDYAIAGVAIALSCTGAIVQGSRIVFFALGNRPVVADRAAAALDNQPLDEHQIDRAAAALALDLDPPTDSAMSAATRMHFARVILRRALIKLGAQTTRSAA